MRETVVKNKQIEQNMFLLYIYIYILVTGIIKSICCMHVEIWII